MNLIEKYTMYLDRAESNLVLYEKIYLKAKRENDVSEMIDNAKFIAIYNSRIDLLQQILIDLQAGEKQ